ncbi:serpin family protein, partial [Bacteroidota bacterium]
IWYKQEYTVNDSFKDIIENSYYGGINPINTSDPASKDIINSWVEEKTNDKIKNLVKEVNPADVMFLVNAIYFNAVWKYEFNKELTFDGSFKKEDGSFIDCKYMDMGEVDLNTYNNSEMVLVEIPYGNGDFNMCIILPLKDNKVDDILENLNSDTLDFFISNANISSINLLMPKFKIEYEQKLNDVLISMGMPKAFSMSAEFPNLFENIEEGLFIDRVNHKTFIEVDEEGTEAAAATVVVVAEFSAITENIIRLDKPFIYLIREKTTGVILFAGKLMEPVNQ